MKFIYYFLYKIVDIPQTIEIQANDNKNVALYHD